MTKKIDTEWYKFEVAVTEFLAAFDKNATVTHDVSIPDKDTGKPRQRDVWIETKVCGFKVKIYVSCKNYNKPLDQQDIDAVIGELRSSGANKGVVFSKLGFAEDALLKAQVNDIECCSLINTENHQRIIPDSLILKQFAGKPTYNYKLRGVSSKEEAKRFFFSNSKENGEPIINLISEFLKELENESLKKNSEPVSKQYTLFSSEIQHDIQLDLMFDWTYYSSDLTGTMVNGYYNFGDSKWKGEMVFPGINKEDPNLGPAWSKCAKPTATNYILISLLPDATHYLDALKKTRDKL